MTEPLYTTEILRLAGLLPDPQRLERVDGTAEERSPTCGSTVRVQVQLDHDRRIAAISQEVQACAFGQAAATLVARNAPGQHYEEVSAALVHLGGWLAGERADAGPWPGFELLAPARGRRSRHGAILLPLRAVITAMNSAAK